MRTLILVSAAVLLAACSDNPQPTAPRSIGSATTGAGADRNMTPVAAGKPVDQVGFTKVVKIVSPQVTIDGVTVKSQTATATCPAGTTLTGGGYKVINGELSSRIAWNMPNGTNGWDANIRTEGATIYDFVAFALCAS